VWKHNHLVGNLNRDRLAWGTKTKKEVVESNGFKAPIMTMHHMADEFPLSKAEGLYVRICIRMDITSRSRMLRIQ
jgi:hypothetical protein